jgi:hypothetical protein
MPQTSTLQIPHLLCRNIASSINSLQSKQQTDQSTLYRQQILPIYFIFPTNQNNPRTANMTSGIDGLYLMNATSGSGHKSGMAFYFDLNSAGVGKQPDNYIDIGNAGHFIQWEGQTIQGTI